MNPTARFIPLQQIVKDFMMEADLPGSNYLRLWNIAVRGLDDIGMDFFTEPVTRKLGVNPNLTVDLPQDYVNWIKVGVLNGNGEIATLKRNPQLSSNAVIAHDRLENNSDTRLGEDQTVFIEGYRNFYWQNEFFRVFGAESGTTNLGEFDVKEKEGLIYLKSGFTYDYIILEYLPSPSATEDFLVPLQTRECLIAWLAWRDILNKPTSRRNPGNDKLLRKREYYNQRNLARRRLNPFRLNEANDAIRQGMKLAVKS